MSRGKAFGIGVISGIMEPIFGIIAILLGALIVPVMPWLLCFAAGAMLFVVVEELIPAAHLGEHSHPGTIGVLAGFIIMMILDVALG
jgi:ZIP family zinc transporter